MNFKNNLQEVFIDKRDIEVVVLAGNVDIYEYMKKILDYKQ